MRRSHPLRLALVLALAVVALPGCAARWAFRQGGEARDRGDWDLAVARYTKALDRDSRNIKYKIALESARVQASRVHYDKAKQHLAANDLRKAADELQIASNFDPANRSASDDLEIVRRRLRRQEDEQRERERFEETRARGQSQARSPVPALSPRSQVPVSLRFEDAYLQKIFESLARIAGVNVLFDEGFRDKKASVNLTGISFQEALDRLTFVNRLFYKVLDQNTIIVVPESRQKRIAYDEQLLRTFYVQNAEVNDTVNLVKTLAKVTTVAGNPSIGGITVLGTVDQLAMAERIIESNDKARGEVIVEVQILEVNRNNLRKWGIDLSNYEASATLSPTGASGESASGVLQIRPYLLSSLNQADWIVSIPSQILTRFLQNESTAKLLASPRLRAAEGKKAELKIGTEVPIPQTSYTVGLSSGATGGYLPATSFTYKNVGVNLSFTPRIAASGDITLELSAEFSSLGAKENVGSKSNEILVPSFLTRNVTGVLRLRDGETGLIGGLISNNETSSFGGPLGVDGIPVLGKLFGSRERKKDESEVLISITPRIVRAPKVTEEDFVPLRVGTQEVPRVEGARPALFGPEPEAPAGGGSAAAAPGAAATPRAAGRRPEAVPAAGPSTPPVAAQPPAEAAAPLPSAPATTAPGTAPSTPASTPSTPNPSTAAPSAVPPSAAAAPSEDARPVSALLSPPEASLSVGQSTGLALVLVGAKDVQWVELALVFDPALVEVTDVGAGSLLTLDGTTVVADKQTESGRARARFTRATGVSGSGAVAAITVRGLKPGSGSLVVESLAVGRAGATERPAPPAAGRLVVAP